MNITKEIYLEKLEQVKLKQTELNQFKNKLRDAYIESNKPCNVDDLVEIISSGGSLYVGKVVSFGLFGLEVFVNAIHDGTKNRYLSKPPRSLKVVPNNSQTENNQ